MMLSAEDKKIKQSKGREDEKGIPEKCWSGRPPNGKREVSDINSEVIFLLLLTPLNRGRLKLNLKPNVFQGILISSLFEV